VCVICNLPRSWKQDNAQAKNWRPCRVCLRQSPPIPPPEATVQRLADRERDVHVQGLQVASCICRGQPEGIWKDRRSNQCLGFCVISYTPAHVLGVGGSPKVRHSFSILDVASPPSQQPISYLEIRLANVQAWCLLRSLLSSACYHTSSKSNGVDCPMGLQ
jgi:hypothetical protein